MMSRTLLESIEEDNRFSLGFGFPIFYENFGEIVWLKIDEIWVRASFWNFFGFWIGVSWIDCKSFGLIYAFN